jgi:hypothetical protein
VSSAKFLSEGFSWFPSNFLKLKIHSF